MIRLGQQGKVAFLSGSLNLWQRQCLEAIGLDDADLIQVPGGYHCVERLIYPSLLDPRAFISLDPYIFELFNCVKWHFRFKYPAKSCGTTSRRIYVSRQDAPHRRMINEEELIVALENIGFNAVMPSKMTYEEQVETFSRLCGRNPWHAFLTDSRIGVYSNHCVTGIRRPDMLTGMTERDWLIALEVFDTVQSNRGEPGHDDRKFLEAIHYFTVHSITWRALPNEFGNWNSVWKRFWRLSRSGVFEAFFQILAECSETAHLIQFFDSTTVRAHVSAAGAKGGSSIRPSAARVAASRPKFISRPISTAILSTST
jgi:transposase